MTGALVRKELRQLLPLIVGLGALALWGIVDEFIFKAPDMVSWGSKSWTMNGEMGAWVGVSELVLGVLVAYSLLPGEHDQRTIEFLYTLPVRRGTLFLVKYLTGCGILAALDVLGTAEIVLLHALNPTSFNRHALRPNLLLMHLAADLALPLIFVAYGMLLSFFRRLGWVLFAMIWLILEIVERVWAPLRVLNVKALFMVEHHGVDTLVNWRAWQIHAAMGAAALLLAARLWTTRQENFAAFYDRLRTGVRMRRLALVVAMLAIAGTMAGMVGSQFTSAEPETSEPQERVLSFETEKFQFTYPASRANQAMIVVRAGDQAYQQVRRWLGGPELEKIVADLTEESNEHAGIAGWKKMRLDVRAPKSQPQLLHALYHETTHVVAAALLEGTPSTRESAMTFFSEGLAEYVSYELLGDRQQERGDARRIAGVARGRFRLRFEDLLDPKAFLRRHDEYLLYAIGEVWIAALVETCGQQAPARLSRTFAGAEIAQTLSGLDLWRQGLQAQRCDLDRVIGKWEQRLRRLESEAVDLPVATGNLVGEEDGELIFEVTVQAPSPGPFRTAVRVRADSDSPPDQIRVGAVALSVGSPRRVSVPVPDRLDNRLEFQVGALTRSGGGRALFSRWQSTTRPSANLSRD